MSVTSKFLFRLKTLFRRGRMEDDLSDELQFHLQNEIQKNIAAGMTPEESRYAALRSFGGVDQRKEQCRDVRRVRVFDELWQDLRYGLRMLAKNPGFSTVAVFTLALGIGATTAVFSVVDRILFRSLPYAQDDRLVSVGIVAAAIHPQEFMMGRSYVEWRDHQTPFAALTSWTGVTDCDLNDQSPVRLSCAQVESTFLPTLGVQPVIGRSFTREEDHPEAPKVALLSYGLWRSRFGGDRGVIDKTIPLDGRPVRVVGILPPDFEMPTLVSVDLIIPQRLDEAVQRKANPGRLLWTFARLKPAVTIMQAETALQPLFEEARKLAPPQFRKEIRLRVRSLRDRQVQEAQLASRLLLGAVMAVLLLACANVANLLLARAASRQRELSMRAALGASRMRLVRQSLTESVLLGLLGGASGCTLSYLLLRFFISIAPEGILRLQQAGLDLRVLVFALGLSILSGILFGLAPAFTLPQTKVLMGWHTLGAPYSRFRPVLVATQMGVSLVLLTGAGLLLQSLRNLQKVPLGMGTENVLTASFVLSRERYPEAAQQVAFFEELERRLKSLPGITAVAITDSLPPSDVTRSQPFAALHQAASSQEGGMGDTVIWRYVTPGYFAALSIPILHGRGFQKEDRNPGEQVVIVSRRLAERLFPNEAAVGKRIGSDTVIGVAGDVKNSGLSGGTELEYYHVRNKVPDRVFQNQAPPYGWRRASVIVRSPMHSGAMENWVRAEITQLDPTLPVTLETMMQRVKKLAQRPRFNAMLLGLFACSGLLLAAVGLYGLLSFLVTQQTQEIGVRLALGATPREIMKLVVSRAARWTVTGAGIGLVGSLIGARWMRTMLFQIPEKDPWSLSAALALLLTAALLAAWIPSRRAAKVDPLVALRHE